AGTASRAAAAREAAAAPAVDGSSDWAAVKAEFGLSPEWLHFSQFYIVSHPRPVRAAIERLRGLLDAEPFTTVEHGMGFDAFLGEQTREDPYPVRVQQAAARYVGGRPQEIALTDSTTQGLALIYQGLTLKPGDEILCTTHDHYVHHEAIRLAAEKSGAKTRRVALYDDPANTPAEEMVTRLKRAIGPYTRVVGITWVHSSTGVKIPARALAQAVAEVNRARGESERILVVLDAVHGFGNQEEQIAHLGVDFAAAGTHKWIFAPRGTGIVWVPEKNWGRIRPTIPTFYDIEPYAAWEDQRPPKAPTSISWISPGGFKAFEHQWAMSEAFDFHERIGRKRIAERTAALNTQCKEGLARIPGVKVFTPREPALSAGIICFEVSGQRANETVHKLHARKVVASSSPYKISHARLAPSLVNDEREVEAALRAVREIV
ncbi:MAG TPA: aminotransferase class V-fold PLP-dependent enzyme, partial [Steroidobacteraceae bacterium]|nr:aminotransferase class V-fold PLP-dependent enzyme [Steroidobacteraceae bacterium]